MDCFFYDVNGTPVPARDMYHGPQLDSHLSHVERDDEDDVATDCSDVGELSESENEDHKGGMFRKIHPREQFTPFQSAYTPLKLTMNEGDDHPPANSSKGKEKERERSATPEPQNQAQAVDHADLLRFLIGTAEKNHRYSPYAFIDEPRVKGIRGPPTDSGDSDFVSPKWYRRRDMFSHFMPSFRTRSRRPLPEFVAGPSRITLDDLY